MEKRKVQKIQRHYYFRLAIISALIGVLSCLLAFSLKKITEIFQEIIFEKTGEINPLLYIVLPSVGITAIYFMRKYLFQNRKNKGITEIYKTVDFRKDHLPFFKIPSHYFNGFLTVIFGGSTGVEVSTVVATATVGNQIYEKQFSANVYKLELICAGVCAGVAILFGSPIAGWLFAMEVIARKINKSLIISCTASAIVSAIALYLIQGKTLLPYEITEWKYSAIPFFIILSILGGVLSVYFTLAVIKIFPIIS